MFQYKQDSRDALKLAQLLALYSFIDAICLKYMTLATYCVLKLSLTSTFKYQVDTMSGEWVYSSMGIPHRLWRLVITTIAIPCVCINDIIYQLVYRDELDPYKKLDYGNKQEAFSWQYWIFIYFVMVLLHLFNTVLVYQKWACIRMKQLTIE